MVILFLLIFWFGLCDSKSTEDGEEELIANPEKGGTDASFYLQIPITTVISVGFLLFFVSGVVFSLLLMITRKYMWKKKNYIQIDSACEMSKYKPVVCIHGLLDAANSLNFFADVIKENHPGTEVILVNLYNGLSSLTPLWKQVEKFKEEIEKLAEEYPQGIHLVGVSQGTLLARGVLETSNKHNVDTFISIAGPHLGQYGVPMVHWVPGYTCFVKNVYRFFYTNCCQKLSVPEFWKDPRHIDEYKAFCAYLPILNNEIPHSRSKEFKENFLKLKSIVLLGGPDDGFITPWQSSHFGYLDDQLNVVEMEDQEVYKKDSFGLRTLNEKKALTLYTIPNVAHYYYVYDEPLIVKYILPHLT